MAKNAIMPVKGVSQEQLALVKRTVAKDATNDELAMFMHIAKKAGLDPFLKQIWFYKDHKGNAIILTGRDGFLSIAMNTGEFRGIQSAAIYDGDKFTVDYSNPDDIHINHASNPFAKEKGQLVGAWARVRRANCIDTVEVVELKDYKKTFAGKMSMWDKYPTAMIKKVAEAIALKKQFGVAGITSTEEMAFDNEEVNPATQIDGDGLFSQVKTSIAKLSDPDARIKAYENAIKSGQFSESQILELETLKTNLWNEQQAKGISLTANSIPGDIEGEKPISPNTLSGSKSRPARNKPSAK